MKKELILEIIQERWSPYSFSPAPVEEFKLKAMFEAASCAPSCNSGKPNRWAFHDTGMAVSNLLLQALALDVYVHQMGGYSVEKVKEYFKLGDDIEPVAMMAIGYLGDGSSLTPELLKRDETRRPGNL